MEVEVERVRERRRGGGEKRRTSLRLFLSLFCVLFIAFL